ncbi:glycosyltransferase family 2 protein [Hyphomicrobium sp.]|uniref:glycosyltransferase family 2 protein n=1 Tax=Hyphomicrobium sp. TaxID=82 RepID=UPI001DD68DD6|nr:glycosyltransferase family 2 protein [Hyphomicrobium sp.]MBY0560449.1 glycosyltransferase family 2 protein [Hyphomicrobium sp.]
MNPQGLSVEDIFVLIPALNEAESIASVIGRLRALGCYHIRVVNNGSTDDTAAIARGAGAVVIDEPVAGYGMACWRGLQDLPEHARWVLFCDADGCDELEALPRFIAAAREGADLVLADRLSLSNSAEKLTLPQRFGNRLAVVLIRLVWGARFNDLGPMRLVNRLLLDEIDMKDRGFGWTVEMQIRAAQLFARFTEIPVTYQSRRHGRSKISGTVRGVIMAGTTILSTIAYHALWPRGADLKIASLRRTL